MVRKIDADTLLNMKLFKTVTHVDALDSFEVVGSTIVFVVERGNAARAIGSNGKNTKTLQNRFSKNVKIIEKTDDCESLIKSFVYPIKPRKCIIDGDLIELEFNSSRNRRILLDNQQKGLKELKETVMRYYPKIKNIKIR